MAGDWLKFEKATLDKPEVFEMAAELGIDPDAVIGKLLRVWNWFDDQSQDGNAPVTVMALLDRYAGVTGFMQAMEDVGWLEVGREQMYLPNFGRHNGQTSKARAMAARRTAKSRVKCNDDTVTPTVTKTLPEKRREEKSSNSSNKRESYPTEKQFIEYLVESLPGINPEWTKERSERAAKLQFETYSSANWHDGNGKKINNWKIKARNAFAYKNPQHFGKAEKKEIETTNGINVRTF